MRSYSHDSLPSHGSIGVGDNEVQMHELEEALRKAKLHNTTLEEHCLSLKNSVSTLEHALTSRPAESEAATLLLEPLRKALHEVQCEKRELLGLLKKYQRLAISYREADYKQFLKAMEGSFRKRASTTDDSNTLKHTRTIGVEAIAATTISEESESIYEPLKDSSDSWLRRPSGSSSYLYAGVEFHAPARPPSLKGHQDASVECSLPSGARILPALTLLLHGCWLYKYPRRQYNKLISQSIIPTAQLSYRYFWLHPLQSMLLWSSKQDGADCKQVKVLDFYTEARMLSAEEHATIVVVLTEEETPLALVPTKSEDLSTWLAGLGALLKMKRNYAWPDNLAICAINY